MPESEMTTVMIRNIPNKYTQRMVLQVLRHHGFGRCFDFIYLPIDFRNRANVGYGFVNFVKPIYARQFAEMFEGMMLPGAKSRKVLQIGFAKTQGLEANIDQLRQSAVMTAHVAPEFKPLMFNPNTGDEMEFPSEGLYGDELPHSCRRMSQPTCDPTVSLQVPLKESESPASQGSFASVHSSMPNGQNNGQSIPQNISPMMSPVFNPMMSQQVPVFINMGSPESSAPSCVVANDSTQMGAMQNGMMAVPVQQMQGNCNGMMQNAMQGNMMRQMGANFLVVPQNAFHNMSNPSSTESHH